MCMCACVCVRAWSVLWCVSCGSSVKIQGQSPGVVLYLYGMDPGDWTQTVGLGSQSLQTLEAEPSHRPQRYFFWPYFIWSQRMWGQGKDVRGWSSDVYEEMVVAVNVGSVFLQALDLGNIWSLNFSFHPVFPCHSWKQQGCECWYQRRKWCFHKWALSSLWSLTVLE